MDGSLKNNWYYTRSIWVSDLLFLIIVCGFLYANSLNGPFIVDDHSYVVSNRLVQEGGDFLSYFGEGFCEASFTGKGCPIEEVRLP